MTALTLGRKISLSSVQAITAARTWSDMPEPGRIALVVRRSFLITFSRYEDKLDRLICRNRFGSRKREQNPKLHKGLGGRRSTQPHWLGED